MKNKEKFHDEIFEIACSGGSIAVDKETKKPVNCKKIICENCLFLRKSNCTNNRKYWCESEYKELQIDWNKVPIDTPIWVRDCEEEEWVPRYFAKFEDGYVYAFNNGATSWSSSSDLDCSLNWRYAKLEEMEEYND